MSLVTAHNEMARRCPDRAVGQERDGPLVGREVGSVSLAQLTAARLAEGLLVLEPVGAEQTGLAVPDGA